MFAYVTEYVQQYQEQVQGVCVLLPPSIYRTQATQRKIQQIQGEFDENDPKCLYLKAMRAKTFWSSYGTYFLGVTGLLCAIPIDRLNQIGWVYFYQKWFVRVGLFQFRTIRVYIPFLCFNDWNCIFACTNTHGVIRGFATVTTRKQLCVR